MHNKQISTGQTHEDDCASMVIVCAPSALSKMMGSLHPAGALYEKPVNISHAEIAHTAFVRLLEKRNIMVRDVRSILMERVDWSVGDHIALENLAFNCLTYAFRNNESSDEESEKTKVNGNRKKTPDERNMAADFYVSDKYKRQVIQEMGHDQLVDIIFTNPTVTICPSPRDTGFTASYQFDPLSNIMFVRDQQITTKKGIVMARLRSSQRTSEVDIMEFCFQKLGLNVLGRIPAPGHLEGGDFFPLGDQLCLIGIGPRSDWTAVEYLLSNDLFGTESVGIVKDMFEMKQERMHLDTVFNVLSKNCCVMLEEMIGENSPTRRLVDEYVHISSPIWGSNSGLESKVNKKTIEVGEYRLYRRNVEFSQYLKNRGFNIIPVSGEDQLNYGCNLLNVGDGNIISIEKNTARKIALSPHFNGTIEFLDFSGVTAMYGGVHCASQVISRRATSNE